MRNHDRSVFCILFVCTGNICRSPMAEAVLRQLASEHDLASRIHSASAGIDEYHVGETADPRTLRALERAGLDMSTHRAQHFERDWFAQFDLIIALDRGQARVLRTMAAAEDKSRVKLLMQFDPEAESLDVPDPYYSDESFFDEVLQQVDAACRKLFAQLEPAIRPHRGG